MIIKATKNVEILIKEKKKRRSGRKKKSKGKKGKKKKSKGKKRKKKMSKGKKKMSKGKNHSSTKGKKMSSTKKNILMAGGGGLIAGLALLQYIRQSGVQSYIPTPPSPQTSISISLPPPLQILFPSDGSPNVVSHQGSPQGSPTPQGSPISSPWNSPTPQDSPISSPWNSPTPPPPNSVTLPVPYSVFNDKKKLLKWATVIGATLVAAPILYNIHSSCALPHTFKHSNIRRIENDLTRVFELGEENITVNWDTNHMTKLAITAAAKASESAIITFSKYKAAVTYFPVNVIPAVGQLRSRNYLR